MLSLKKETERMRKMRLSDYKIIMDDFINHDNPNIKLIYFTVKNTMFIATISKSKGFWKMDDIDHDIENENKCSICKIKTDTWEYFDTCSELIKAKEELLEYFLTHPKTRLRLFANDKKNVFIKNKN